MRWQSLKKIKVFHIDDDPSSLTLTKIFLEKINSNISIESFTSQFEMLQILKRENVDCIIVDYKMPNMNGLELVNKIKNLHDIPIVLYTSYSDEEMLETAFAAGVDDFVQKGAGKSHFSGLTRRIESLVYNHVSANKSVKNKVVINLVRNVVPKITSSVKSNKASNKPIQISS